MLVQFLVLCILIQFVRLKWNCKSVYFPVLSQEYIVPEALEGMC